MSKEKASSRINGNVRTNSRKSFSPVMIILPLLIVAAVAGVIIITLNKEEPEKNFVVTPDNIEEVIAKQEEKDRTPTGSYEIVMTTDWHFKDSESVSDDAYVKNAVSNRNTVYFTIRLADSEEEIYKSPFIPVGSSLTGIALDYPLDAGKHDAVLTYHLVDKSNVEISKVSVAITITIDK